ncbi:MAG TPA: WbqC family protein [Bacteroidales bacterium]|nr:WbqC family protein [Bacteroidales bacterium]
MNDQSHTTLLSTAYLPPIEYFVQIDQSDEIYIEQFENYHKQTFRNRCHIASANGLLPLSIPVIKTDGNHTLIKNIAISNAESWQKIHWRAIESAYNKSPFFLYYEDELRPFYVNRFENLLEFNMKLTEKLLHLIGIEKKINLTTGFVHQPENMTDCRFREKPKQESCTNYKPYIQVFSSKFKFFPNLSIIDLLFCEGPDAADYLNSLA